MTVCSLCVCCCRRVLGFSTVKEMYQWFACAPLLKNVSLLHTDVGSTDVVMHVLTAIYGSAAVDCV